MPVLFVSPLQPITAAHLGAPVAADPSVTAAIDPATRAVNVTGFDFNQNYVSTNAKADGTFGKKLIIEFDVSVEAGFLAAIRCQRMMGSPASMRRES